MVSHSKIERPKFDFEPRPFVSQTKVAFETPSTIVYDKKFDSALRMSHIQQHYSRVASGNLTLDDKLTVELTNYPTDYPDIDLAASCFARLMTHMRELETSSDPEIYLNNSTPETTHRILSLVHKNLQVQIGYLNEQNYLPGKDLTYQELKKIFTKETKDLSFINSLFDFSNWLLGVINMSNGMYAQYFKTLTPEQYITDLRKTNLMKYHPLDLEISWSHNYCVLFHGGLRLLLPKNYILLIHNKVCDIISTLLYVKYARHSSLPEQSYKVTLEFLDELWRLCNQYGQQYFGIAKCLEALVIGETLCDIESWDNSEFLSVIVKDLRTDIGFNYATSTIKKLIRQSPVELRHELGCLSKISGHPFVDMKDGAEKMHKYTTEEYNLDYDLINESLCYAKQNYIRNHIVRENKWPPHVITSSSAPMALQIGSLRNKDPEGGRIQKKYGKIKVQDYNFVELKQSMKFNKLENAIPHLKDKTISLMRSPILGYYMNKQQPKEGWAFTRLLLYYLLHDEGDTDHIEFINNYNKCQSFDDLIDYLIIRIVPKEKELKVAFRGFGCTTFHNRMLFLAQEKNAMHYLDLYCDEQAMTLSELALVKRLYAFRCLKMAYPKHRVFYATVDASKWNNHFRPETCDNVQKELLDKIFGVHIYGKTQKKYQNTFFYVPDGDEHYTWEGQSGGIEGLNQDTWVVTYIPQIKTSLSGMDVKYHVLCKGDDLRLAILIPESDIRSHDMKATGKSIMNLLAAAATGLGHDIKIYESHGSEHYFNFSKSASIDKVEMPQVFRKIQKCYGATNAFLPTLDEYIGSTFSNAHSACRVTTNVLPCYVVALVWSYYYLLSDEKVIHKKRFKNNIYSETIDEQHEYYANFTDDELVALLLCPSLSGGFPIIYLHNMMVRAESDLLSPFIDIYQYCINTGHKGLARAMRNFFYFDCTKKKSWKPLYSDPYCLPLMKPTTASQKMKSLIVPALGPLVKHDAVKELIELVQNDSASEKCIKSMDKSTICHAKVFSVIYSALPECILQEIVNKFESSRSVMELLVLRRGRRGADNLLRSVIKADIHVQRWRKNRMKGFHKSGMKDVSQLLVPCPANSALIVREHCWQKPVDGVTMSPARHTMSFVTPLLGHQSAHMRSNHFTYYVDCPTEFVGGHNNFHYGVGNKHPFLGNVTSSATLSPLLNMVEKDAILSKLKNIAELATWTDYEQIMDDGTTRVSNVRTLISKIITIYTKEPLETLAPFVGTRKSGTIAHHIRVRHFRESIMPNSLSNVYQFIQGETNSHRKFHGDRNHYWINFLQCYCHTINMITFELNVHPRFITPECVWAVTTECEFCLRNVEEPAIIIDEDVLKHARYSQIRMTKLGNATLGVLKESLGLAKDKRYNIRGHIDTIEAKFATVGLFSILCENTVKCQESLADRYTQHPGDRESRTVMSSFMPKRTQKILTTVEISCLDLPTIVTCLVVTIFQLLASKLHIKSIINLESALMVLPSRTLPWYPIVEELHRAGKLPSVVRAMAELSNSPALHLTYTPDQVTPHLGVSAINALEYIRLDYPIVILSNFSDVEISDAIRKHMFSILWSELLKELPYAKDTERELDNRIENIVPLLLLMSSNVMDELTEVKELPIYSNDPILVSDLLELDTEAFEELAALDEEELVDKLSPYIFLVSRYTKIPPQHIARYIMEHVDEITSLSEEKFNVLTINFYHTTPLACIDTIRSLPSALAPSDNIDEFEGSPLTGMQNFFQPIDTRSQARIHRLPPYISDFGMRQFVADVSDTTRSRRVINNEYSQRAFGCSNDTMNRLRYIFHHFRNPDHLDTVLEHVSVHCMGDGIGNGTAFFGYHFKNSRFIFTTKPDRSYINIYPSVADNVIKQHNHLIANDHVREGIFDLTESHTFEHLIKLYNGQNIYFCDAEPSPGSNYIYGLYQNVVRYFLDSRFNDSILILQLSIEAPHKACQVLSVLGKYCTNVYVVLPPSVKCVFSHYVIAWGNNQLYSGDITDHDYQTPITYVNMMQNIIDFAVYVVNSNCGGNTRSIYLRSTHPACNTITSSLPPLWISYVQKQFNHNVTKEQLMTIKQLAFSSDTIDTIIQNVNFPFSTQTRYYHGLLDGDNADSIIKDSPYNMNYRQHRIYICSKYFELKGWETIWNMTKTTLNVTSERHLRTIFLQICRTLPQRDYDPNIKYDQIFSKAGMKYPDGSLLPYWNSFCLGCEMYLSFLSWVTMLHNTTAPARIQRG
jgi:hypothetical protein